MLTHRIKLTSEEMRYIALFENVTGATANDCIIDEDKNRIIFVTKQGDKGLAIGQRVRVALGARDDSKEWLAACLLKTVKDNQRWHDREELIDGFPAASSWLAKRL